MEKNVLENLTAHEALFTGRVKLYPNRDGGEDEAQILICDKPIFNPFGLELRGSAAHASEKRSQKSNAPKVFENRDELSEEEKREEFVRSLRSSNSELFEEIRAKLCSEAAELSNIERLKFLCKLCELEKLQAFSNEELIAHYFATTPQEFLQNSEKNAAANFERSCRRAKAKLYDIVMCTHSFKYFVTLTVSPETADRTDYKAIMKRFNVWLDNKVRRNGLCYALVPEFHKDGVSIHFHGFFNDALALVDSGKRTKDGKIKYNIPAFKFGHNCAIEITGSYVAACRYILKYVGKSGTRVGARFYLSGGALGAPRYEYFNAHIDDLDSGKVFAPQGSGLTFRVDKKL